LDAKRETYRDAGVDIDAADKIKKSVRKQARSTFTTEVLGDLGFFGGLFELKGYKEPVIVSSTDGVGTKLKIACALDKHDTIGADLVNHCVNDILTCGASPLFFQDYIAMSQLDLKILENIIDGMVHALTGVGCVLIGGETAEMPGLYPKDEYDLAGFIVGAVEKSSIINGSSITAGDPIIGLPSSGLHTNGYSLVRKLFNIERYKLNVFYPELGCTLGEELLKIHRCYYPALKPFLAEIKGMAHITGGGIPGNLPRILPKGLAAKINQGVWEALPIFSLIQRQGNIDEQEMYHVFNMGLGMIVITAPRNATKLLQDLPGAILIGEVMEQKDERRVIIQGL
jgi:phosphoribosylformylglycinamidine cyclo-ligase